VAVDREAVRDISYRTGFMGESAESFWRHKESWADLWTSYYTDQEPESLYVTTMDDSVVGYLAGCMDTAAMTPSTDETMKAVIRKRWLLFRRGTAGFQAASGEFIDPRWPAHLHIDLLPVARGSGLGAALMERWLDQLKESSSPGCHLLTLLENRRALSFFENMGFRRPSSGVSSASSRCAWRSRRARTSPGSAACWEDAATRSWGPTTRRSSPVGRTNDVSLG